MSPAAVEIPRVVEDVRSLDERYLEFRDRTAKVFAAFPQLEPMRHAIFKQLLINRAGADWKDTFKHWTRPLRSQGRSQGTLAPADVVLWLETPREVVSGALLPVLAELRQRQIKVQVVSHGAGDVEANAYFCVPKPQSNTPRWAGAAWDALVQVVPDLLSPSLRRAFGHAAAQTQSVMDEAARVLETCAPAAVLSATTHLPGGAALAMAARRRQVPSYLLQHGITQVFYTPPLADCMITWGQSSNDTLIGLGENPKTLLALGSPRHDTMQPSAGAAQQEARIVLQRALGLPDLPTLVFFSNGNDLVRNGCAPQECAAWLEAVARELKGQINVVVRLHPNEDGSLYHGANHLCLTKGEVALEATLDGCDAVASLCSTVLYEALLFRTPVWQFFADGWPELADNWKDGLAKRVDSPATLRTLCTQLAGGDAETPSTATIERVFANHGHAAVAVADEVMRHLKR